MIRPPAVSGRFYPAVKAELARAVDEIASVSPRGLAARACMVPHAGYIYSGRVAGEVYSRLALPSRFLILGPRHYPRGEHLAILTDGAWRTPLGDASVDKSLAQALQAACPLLKEDEVAHRTEHSLEVQIPFLQRLAPGFRFVPIALGTVRYEELEAVGRAVGAVIAKEKEPVLIVASSDMNHYESDATTREKDRKAIDRILALDPRGLYDTVQREEITMCGYGPAVAMLTAAKLLGATKSELVRYATSGEVNGDWNEVVGYAGIIVS